MMEDILNYLTRLARDMVACGATIEHVEIALEKTAEAYHLKGMSMAITHQHVSICFSDRQGKTYMKQMDIPEISIHLEKLKVLNEISSEICSQTPAPQELWGRLRKSRQVRQYKKMTIALCQVLAICSICLILGGGLSDVLGTAIVSFTLFWINQGLARLRTVQMINNVISMFAVTVLAFILVRLGLMSDTQWTLISVSLLMIPGIPLINAFRNLICGNEFNGVMQLLNVFLESASLAAGTFLGVILMGGAKAW